MEANLFHYNGYVLETHLNGNGYYIKESNTILGALYDAYGHRIETRRVNYDICTPMTYAEQQIFRRRKSEKIEAAKLNKKVQARLNK